MCSRMLHPHLEIIRRRLINQLIYKNIKELQSRCGFYFIILLKHKVDSTFIIVSKCQRDSLTPPPTRSPSPCNLHHHQLQICFPFNFVTSFWHRLCICWLRDFWRLWGLHPPTTSTSPVSRSLPLRCHLLGYILTCGSIISQSDFLPSFPVAGSPPFACICLAPFDMGVMEISTCATRLSLFGLRGAKKKKTHMAQSLGEYIVCVLGANQWSAHGGGRCAS